MSVRIRLRLDSAYDLMFNKDPKLPPMAPGDTWGLFNQRGERIAYLICCPKCLTLHSWCRARNCASRRPLPSGGFTCDHEARGVSCWEWTGTPEDGTLTGRPSLHSVPEYGGCGWHGFLTSGELIGC